jgi:hypothetical protein
VSLPNGPDPTTPSSWLPTVPGAQGPPPGVPTVPQLTPQAPRRRMSKGFMIIGTLAALVVIAGTGTVGYAVMKDTPAGRTVLDTVGIATKTYTQADAEAALLALADLPGYAVAPPNDKPGDDTSSTKPCANTTFTPNETVTKETRRQVSLTKSALGPYLSHMTGLVPSGTTLDKLRTIFRSCPSWTEANGDKYLVSDANYGSYGDETYSVRLTITTSAMTIGTPIVIIRKGNLMSMLIMAGFPDVSGAEVLEVAQKAAAKLPK